MEEKKSPRENYLDNEHMFAYESERASPIEERECVKNEGENMFALSRESEACSLICPPGESY